MLMILFKGIIINIVIRLKVGTYIMNAVIGFITLLFSNAYDVVIPLFTFSITWMTWRDHLLNNTSAIYLTAKPIHMKNMDNHRLFREDYDANNKEYAEHEELFADITLHHDGVRGIRNVEISYQFLENEQLMDAYVENRDDDYWCEYNDTDKTIDICTKDKQSDKRSRIHVEGLARGFFGDNTLIHVGSNDSIGLRLPYDFRLLLQLHAHNKVNNKADTGTLISIWDWNFPVLVVNVTYESYLRVHYQTTFHIMVSSFQPDNGINKFLLHTSEYGEQEVNKNKTRDHQRLHRDVKIIRTIKKQIKRWTNDF